jgi:hypothetical protein
MKKRLMLVTTTVIAVLFVFTGSIQAQGQNSISVYGGLGYAFSDYEGLVFDLGLDFQISRNLYIQLLMENYTNPLPDDEDITGAEYKVTGVCLFGMYKFFDADNTFNVFIKGGVQYSTIKIQVDFLNASESDIGAAGGVGIQYGFGNRFGFLLGGNVEMVFPGGGAKNFTWFKVYSGITYRIR